MGQKKPVKKLKAGKQDKKKSGVEDFDLGFFITQINKPESLRPQETQNMLPPAHLDPTFIPSLSLLRELTDFTSDPYLWSRQERKPGKRGPGRRCSSGMALGCLPILMHLVPEELLKLIISSNPIAGYQVHLQPEAYTQLVMDDSIMKKKKGPYMSKGGRTCCWKCSHDFAPMGELLGGAIQDSKQHNSPTAWELYQEKQARFKLREVAGGQQSLVTNVVSTDYGRDCAGAESLGSVDALSRLPGGTAGSSEG